MSTTKRLEILAVVFAGLNIMDLTGPSEVFGSSQIPGNERRITVASSHDTVTSSEGITLKRDISLLELLTPKPDGSMELSRFDVLVMPGAMVANVHAAIEEDHNLLLVLKTFADLKPDGRERWLLSVCTGAGFLGTLGLFSGKTATCHWAYLDTLREICKAKDTTSGEETKIVQKRWVNVGKRDSGVRVVTAGGVSCGIDAALWITSELFDMEKALRIAKAMDYDWKYGKNEFTEGYII